MPSRWEMPPVYLQSGDPETEDVATLHAPGTLGMRFTIVQPPGPGAPAAQAFRSKTYQLIRTDSSMTVTPFPNAVAWWSDKTRYLVTTSPTALGRGRIAGRFPDKSLVSGGGTGSITTGNYGCIQVHGPGRLKFIDAVVVANVSAVGNFVIPSSTAGKADVLGAGSAATYPSLGLTAGALDLGDATAIVDLDVPETT